MKQKSKRTLSIEDALEMATNLLKNKVVPYLVEASLINSDFTIQQTKTIMLWATKSAKENKS